MITEKNGVNIPKHKTRWKPFFFQKHKNLLIAVEMEHPVQIGAYIK